MGARGLSSSKKYTFFLLTRALMCWLSFIKLREILVGIIVGLFLAILFWSGDRYATQPKTGSDSGEFNLRLGLLLWSFFFFLGRALNQRKAQHKEPLDGRLGCFSFKSQKLKVKKIFRIPSAGITMCTSKNFLVVAPKTQTSKTIVFLLPKPIVFDVNCCCQTGWSSCGCLLSTTCCWHREAEILAICFEFPAGIQSRFRNKQSSNDSTQ